MSATAAPAADGKAGKKRSPMLMILIVVIVLLLAGGGGAAYYFMKSSNHEPAAPKVVPPVFFALEAFTVNLAGDADETHYLHVGMTLKVHDAETSEKLTAYLPEIRSRILLLLSSKRPEDLATVEGKNKLSAEVLKTVAEPLAKGGEHAKIESVLLTDFVIQ